MKKGLSNRAAAKMVNCSHVAIGKAIATKMLSTLADGSICKADLLKWNEGRRPHRGGIRNQSPGKELPPQGLPCLEVDKNDPSSIIAARIVTKAAKLLPLAEAIQMKENYNALLKQLEYDKESGLVVMAEDVLKEVGEEYAKVRTRLLAIPSEQAPRIQRLKTVAEVQSVLQDIITEALEELTADEI